MSILKDSTLTPAELANLQLQIQQHKDDNEINAPMPPQQFQLFAPNSLMAQREKVNAQKKILEEQQQKIREEYGNVRAGPLLGTVNKDSKKPKLDGGLVGELDRRAREKELLKKMGLYKPPPPQEHLPSYLQKSGGAIQSNPNINPALLNRNPMMMNPPAPAPPPTIINNPLMRPPPIIQPPPLMRNNIIQNPMVNFGQPGYYPPPAPGSFYGGAIPPPPPHSSVLPNPAVQRHLDYEFDDSLNIHERENLAKSWLEKEREKERQRQFERKAELNMRVSKSYPNNINNLGKYSSDSDNEDEPLGNLAVNSKKKNKKNRYDSESDSESSESSTESESESGTETESDSGTESDENTKKSKKSSKKKKDKKDRTSSIVDTENNTTLDESSIMNEKENNSKFDRKEGKSSTGGEFEKANKKSNKRYSDSDTETSSEDDDYHRGKMMHYGQSGRYGHSSEYYYRRQPQPNVINPYSNYVNNYGQNMYSRMYSSSALGNGRRYSYSESDDSYSGGNRHRRHRSRGKRSGKRRHRRRDVSSSESSYTDDSESSYSSDYSRRRHRRHRHRDKDRKSGKSKSHKKRSGKKSHKKDESESDSEVQSTEKAAVRSPTTMSGGLNSELLEELEDKFDHFVDECIEMRPKFQITQDELYSTFINWWNQQSIAKKAGGQQPSYKDLENLMVESGFTLRPWRKSKHSPEPPADGKDVWFNLKIKN